MADTLKNIKDIAEIIVVDDGSKDTSKQIYSKLTDVTLLTHTQNKGKMQAMLTGLKIAKSEYIFFMDADLIGLTANHINKTINFIKTKKYDSISLTPSRDHKIYKLSGFTAMHSGQRILKRKFLLQHQDEIFTGNSWTIEVNITKALLKYKQRILVCELQNLTHMKKEDKYELKEAYKQKIKMTLQLIMKHKGFGYICDYLRFKKFLKNIQIISS